MRVFPTATNGVTPCSRWHSKPPSAPSYSAGQRCGCCITRRSDPSVGLRFAGGPQVHPRRRLADTRKKMGPFSRPGPNLNELAGSISTYQLKACRRCRGNSSCVRKILGPRSIRGASSGILTSLDLVTIGRPFKRGFFFLPANPRWHTDRSKAAPESVTHSRSARQSRCGASVPPRRDYICRTHRSRIRTH